MAVRGEVRWYRALIVKDRDRVRVISRNEKDLTAAHPAVAGAGRRLEATTAVIDRESAAMPFADLPSSKASHWGGGVTAEQMQEMQWLKPGGVAQIRFVEWTADGHLRHASFLGLRGDKPARAIAREP